MTQAGSWNTRGSDQKAWDAAREAALAEGISLADYLRRMLNTQGDYQPNEVRAPYGGSNYGPASYPPPPRPSQEDPAVANAVAALERLTRRIEDSEARSNLALTGIDHTVLGLAARLDKSEQTAASIASHVESLLEDMRATQDALQAKVRRLENDDTAAENLETLKALEEALGKLASHVFEEAELAQNEAIAIKGRVETGFNDLTERMERVETRIERVLPDAKAFVERNVDEAEQRLRGASQHISERISKLENRAGTLTDAAFKELETSLTQLDQRLTNVSAAADPGLADRLRHEFETRFENMAALLRTSFEDARRQLAADIAQATHQYTDTHSELQDLKARLADLENRPAETDSIGLRQDIERLSASLSERMDALADHVENRIEESEIRSGDAIEQVGEQVTVAAVRLQKRQDEALSALAQDIETARSQADGHLSEALALMAERLEKIQAQSETSLTPVQRAIAALAARLESLEAFTAPPGTDLPRSLPVAGITPQTTTGAEAADAPSSAATAETIHNMSFDDFLSSSEEEPETIAPELTQEAEGTDEAGFESGFSDWENEAEDPSPAPQEAAPGYGADFASVRAAVERLNAEQHGASAQPPSFPEINPDISDDDHMFLASLPDDLPDFAADDYDPLDELAGFEDAKTEARESDIFDEEDSFDTLLSEAATEAAGTSHKPDASKSATDLTDTFSSLPPDTETDDTGDYIARARRAAMAAAETQGRARSKGASPAPGQKQRGVGKAPLYLAASAVVLTGAGAGTYLYLRGKQSPEPTVSGPVDTYVDPETSYADETAPTVIETASAQTGSEAAPAGVTDLVAEEEDLFDTSDMAALEAEMFEAPPPEADTTPPAPVQLATLTPAPAASSYDPIPATASLETEANAGNAIAQYQLSISLRTSGDLTGAIPLLRRAAAKGIAPAQYDLGKLYEHGYGVDQSYEDARTLITSAAEAGHVSAMYDLALFLAEGEGGPADAAASADWFRKAASNGFTDAQYNLGVMYAEGIGVDRDLTEALYWFELASRRGDDGAALEVRNLSSRLPQPDVARAIEKAEAWTETPSAALANGRFGAQSWNAGHPLQVRGVQAALTSLGYLEGAADGVLGPQTANAIRAYQASRNLDVTGTVTPQLIETLNAGARRGEG